MKKVLLVLIMVSIIYPLMAADFYVPSTISKEAQVFLKENFAREIRNATAIPENIDNKGWKHLQKIADEEVQPLNDHIVQRYLPDLTQITLGGVPVLDIRPNGWKDNGKVLIYTHGGAYVFYNSMSSLASSVPVATDTGLRVLSIDYTLAPYEKYDAITDQVINVFQALIKQGYSMSDIAIYGDSAGGGLAAGAVLKMRGMGLELPAAVILWSPWSDITETGDTYHTLRENEPLYRYDLLLKASALAYADAKEQKHPYVSPVYGDFQKPFPPTLIQAGTKELFLSNAVRLYQAIDSNGGEVKLDIYEGMWHVFQVFSFNIPEAKLARKKMAIFLNEKLDIKQIQRINN